MSNEALETVPKPEVMPLSDMNTTLRSLAVNVKSLEESTTSMKWLIGMGIGMIGIITAMIEVPLVLITKLAPITLNQTRSFQSTSHRFV